MSNWLETAVSNGRVAGSPPDLNDKPSNRRLFILVFSGILTELIYVVAFALRYFLPDNYSRFTDMGGWTQYQLSAFVFFIASLIALFTTYWLAFSLTRRGAIPNDLPIVVAFGITFAITMIFMYPVTATDIFGYIVRTRIMTVHDANPYITLPSVFPDDPFFSYIGGWKDWPTPYGPLFILLSAIPSALGGNNLLANLLLFKGVSLVSHLGNVAIIYLIVRYRFPSSRKMVAPAVLFYAWNPLVLFEALGNGHNDVTMMFFVLLAFYSMVSRRFVLAVIATFASVLIKYITLLLLPLVLLYALHSYPNWRQRALFLIQSTVASTILIALVYRPFWQGVDTLAGFLGQANIFISSLPTVMLLLLQPSLGSEAAVSCVKLLSGVVFLVIYLWRLKEIGRDFGQYASVGAELFLIYLIVACAQFETWYVIWPITLAALVTRWRLHELITAFSVGSLLSVALFAYVWPWTQASFLDINLLAVSVILTPPLVVCVFRFFQSRNFHAPVIGIENNSW